MKTLTIMATGHSLTKDQVKYVHRSVTDVMVLNESFLICPWADYLFAGDTNWWSHYKELVKKRFLGECYTISLPASKEYPYPTYLEGINRENSAGGLCKESGKVFNGGNSGHMALNLSYHLGYERVVLLGFDLYGGHWFKPSFRPDILRKASPYEHFKTTLKDIVDDLEKENLLIYNCTPDSKLDVPYTKLEDVL